MPILIDGYNLLHATGYIPAGSNFDSLEGPRRKFLAFLQDRLTSDEASTTTVVFDAAKAPRGVPHRVSFGTIQVLFAHDHAEADDLIEEIIQADNVPHKLTVVSSDHRIHRAARRRRATVIDSDQWYWALHDQPEKITTRHHDPIEAARNPILDETEVSDWLATFGATEEATDEPVDRRIDERIDKQEQTARPQPSDNPETSTDDNPFPPGYGEDLLNNEV